MYVTSMTGTNNRLQSVSGENFAALRSTATFIPPTQQDGVQILVWSVTSQEPWNLPDPARSELIARLNSTESMSIDYTIRWRRKSPETKLYQEYKGTRVLSELEQSSFARSLAVTSSSAAVVIPRLLPRYYDIPSTEGVYVPFS